MTVIRPTFSPVDVYLAVWNALVGLQIREVKNNDGPPVQAIQAVTGNKPPDKYCASTVSAAGVWAFGRHRWPLPISASCDVIMAAAKKLGAFHIPERSWIALGKPKELEHLIMPPRRGQLFLILRDPTDAVHIGAISQAFADASFETGEGNAADPKRPSSVDGTGIFGGRLRNHPADVVKATGKPRLYGLIEWESLLR